MLFNSVEFVVFFVVLFGLYWALPFRGQNWLLLFASYFFYGWWGFFVPELSGLERVLPMVLLATSTVFTHYSAVLLDKYQEGSKRRRTYFWAGVAVNIGMLGYFKYRGFFAENVRAGMAWFGMEMGPAVEHFLLPAGISFYTFQGLSYLIDVFGGSEKPARRFQDFALFHCYFPQLVAGPIERSRRLLPQLTSPRTLTPENLWSGVQLIIIGYVKKVAVADAIAPMTRLAFERMYSQSGLGLLLALYLFALQIYGDFSGYSDIARGVSRLLGVELMINFRQPYFSRNITEFWERWHISLSSWLRDCLFVPLCRIFRGKTWMNVNLFVTMLISGIWHGASWNFVAWGAVLGLMLVIHKIWSGPKPGKRVHPPKGVHGWLLQIAGMVLTFHCVCLTLVFVKTSSLEHAVNFMKGMLTQGAGMADLTVAVYVAFYLLLVITLDFSCWWHNRERPVSDTASFWKRGLVFGGLLFLLTFLGEMKGVSFVYFQF